MSDYVRIGIIRRARTLRREIDQILTDQEYWNAAHPTHVPINVDEDGKLRRLAMALDAMLAKEMPEMTP